MAKPRGRKSRVTSREEISSSSSENEFDSQNGFISENGSESDPIRDVIEESNLIETPSEILPDPLEVLPENALDNDSITEDNPSEYEMQRMENIADKNTFLKKSTKLLDTKVPPKIKRKAKLIIPIFVVIFIRQIFGLIRIFKIFFYKFYGKQTRRKGPIAVG